MKQTKAQKKISKVMGEFKDSKLKSSSGQKVTSKKQAIAIALSEAGKSKPKKYNSGGMASDDTDITDVKAQVKKLAKKYSESPSESIEEKISKLNSQLSPKDKKELKEEIQYFVKGGGGSDKYGTGAGGAFGARKKLSKDTFGEVYGEGYAYKPKEGKLEKELTGYGARLTKTFAKGGVATKSKVNEAGNYTKPGMRKTLFERIKAGDKGGAPGQWSARKAQMLAAQYKAKGGGYKD